MSFREILKYPNPLLRKRSSEVTSFGSELQVLVGDLWDTVNVASGAGISAPQIGVLKRAIYINTPSFRGEMINPTVINSSDQQSLTEGCLSFPGVSEKILRYNNVDVTYFDKGGNENKVSLSGVAAQAVQHEIEHLDGKLMLDHFGPLKRAKISKKVKKVMTKAKTIMSPPEEKKPRRVRSSAHLSQKEIKKRKLNRQRSRKKR